MPSGLDPETKGMETPEWMFSARTGEANLGRELRDFLAVYKPRQARPDVLNFRRCQIR